MTAIVYDKLSKAIDERAKYWNSQNVDIPLSFAGNEMAGEVGEACNVIKKLERERYGLPGSRSTLEHLGRELGDVIITAYLVAKKAGIDLDVYTALAFNDKSDELGFPVHYAPSNWPAHNFRGGRDALDMD